MPAATGTASEDRRRLAEAESGLALERSKSQTLQGKLAASEKKRLKEEYDAKVAHLAAVSERASADAKALLTIKG